MEYTTDCRIIDGNEINHEVRELVIISKIKPAFKVFNRFIYGAYISKSAIDLTMKLAIHHELDSLIVPNINEVSRGYAELDSVSEEALLFNQFMYTYLESDFSEDNFDYFTSIVLAYQYLVDPDDTNNALGIYETVFILTSSSKYADLTYEEFINTVLTSIGHPHIPELTKCMLVIHYMNVLISRLNIKENLPKIHSNCAYNQNFVCYENFNGVCPDNFSYVNSLLDGASKVLNKGSNFL